WIGLDRVGSGWIGLDRVGSGWIGLGGNLLMNYYAGRTMVRIFLEPFPRESNAAHILSRARNYPWPNFKSPKGPLFTIMQS
ncbi:MAG: hypothetical protein ACJAYF_003434, partial [Arenicella sp.]